eukprot:gene560-956_t
MTRHLLQDDGSSTKDIAETIGVEVRSFYYETDTSTGAAIETELNPDSTEYNMFFRNYDTDLDIGYQKGIRYSQRYGWWDTVPMGGVATVNFVVDKYYTYIPGMKLDKAPT